MELPIPKSKKNISYPLKVRVEFAKTAKGLRTKWHEEKQSKKNRRWCQKQKKYVQKNPDWGFIKSTVELHFPGALEVQYYKQAKPKQNLWTQEQDHSYSILATDVVCNIKEPGWKNCGSRIYFFF